MLAYVDPAVGKASTNRSNILEIHFVYLFSYHTNEIMIIMETSPCWN